MFGGSGTVSCRLRLKLFTRLAKDISLILWENANLALNGAVMKYFAFSAMFVFAAVIVQAQTQVPMLYTPKQKPINNGFKMLAPDLQNSKIVPVQNNIPVLQLKNEGVKLGSNNLGDMYSMSADNMPCLKPFATQDEMPNAFKQQS